MSGKKQVILIHTSDFHVKTHESDALSRAHDIRQLMVFDAKKLSKTIGIPTAIVFSGDIANKGQSSEYDIARTMFLQMITELGLNEQCVLVVPGNHDVNRPDAEGLEARILRDKLRASKEEEAEILFAQKRSELLQPIAAFQEFAMPYDCLIQGERGFWEISNKGGSSASSYLNSEFEIVIRGISTVHVSDRNDDQMRNQDMSNPTDYGSHMYIAHGQLSCDPATTDTPFRILVGHHPPIWWRFSEKRKNLADARFHLQLYGHEHDFSPSPSGNSICVKSGAVNPDELDRNPRYNWMRISDMGEGYLVEIWSRVFDTDIHEFVEDLKWPSGQGFLVSKDLKSKPEQITPAKGTQKDQIAMKPMEEKPKDRITEQSIMQFGKKPSSSPHEVRYLLLSKNPSRYSKVFERLGYVPNDRQKFILGGLEFYEESLEELLLPENLPKVVEAMRAEGIYDD